jgi:ubiquinone/menaquinone biosynthesis C-methylase UbiE
MKKVFRKILPSFIWNTLSRIRQSTLANKPTPLQEKHTIENSDKQDLDLYWDANYAKVLEEWGKDNVWNEIQLLLSSKKGKVLDIACGTGITIKILEKYPWIELYGFDISDLLIEKAIEKKIPKERLKIADATKPNYSTKEFDYSYSIGSLEHFTLDGIDKFIGESSRITKKASFHMIPVSKSGTNEGWMKTIQSFFNNSEEWWFGNFKKHYSFVYSIPSKWEDNISYGRWFICVNEI